MAITTEELLRQHPEPRVKAVKLPVSSAIDYNVQLQKIVDAIKKDINEQLIPILRSEQSNYTNDSTWFDRIAVVLERIRQRWESAEFKALSSVIARQFVNAVDDRTQKSLGIDVFGNNEDLQTIIEQSIHDNTRLIRTIPSQYLDQVDSIVVTNTRAGNRSSAMVKTLSEQFGVTQKRARFIARDQTAKVNSAVAQKRIESAGYEYFQWVTSKDARVRDRHDDIANKVTEYGKGVYRFDNPPLSDKGVPILPGTDFGCRCFMKPISRRQVERNKERGETAPGVKR